MQADRVVLYITLREGMKRLQKEGRREEGRTKKREEGKKEGKGEEKEGRAFCYIFTNYFKK